MPKAEPHFDVDALIDAVLAQEIGLRITTNHVENFRQTVYKRCRARSIHVHIYSDPLAPNALYLLKQALPQEQPHGRPPESRRDSDGEAAEGYGQVD